MRLWVWATGWVLGAAGCLAAPPGSTSPEFDAGADPADAGADAAPCDGLAPEGCALFTCGDLPSCYRYCVAETSFTEALELCDRPDSKVLETETIEELSCADAYNQSSIWIGLVQSDKAETSSDGWTWRSTQVAPAETFWGEVEPNDGLEPENGEEQCALIHFADGYWADAECEPIFASVVCEIGAP